MDINKNRNMIVLKNLPSNMIEEAYVVFKDNVKVHKIQEVKQNKTNLKELKPQGYMVKEAEMIIRDYITKIENKEYELGKGNKKLKEKYKKLKTLTMFLAFFSILSTCLIIFR